MSHSHSTEQAPEPFDFKAEKENQLPSKHSKERKKKIIFSAAVCMVIIAFLSFLITPYENYEDRKQDETQRKLDRAQIAVQHRFNLQLTTYKEVDGRIVDLRLADESEMKLCKQRGNMPRALYLNEMSQLESNRLKARAKLVQENIGVDIIFNPQAYASIKTYSLWDESHPNLCDKGTPPPNEWKDRQGKAEQPFKIVLENTKREADRFAAFRLQKN